MSDLCYLWWLPVFFKKHWYISRDNLLNIFPIVGSKITGICESNIPRQASFYHIIQIISQEIIRCHRRTETGATNLFYELALKLHSFKLWWLLRLKACQKRSQSAWYISLLLNKPPIENDRKVGQNIRMICAKNLESMWAPQEPFCF